MLSRSDAQEISIGQRIYQLADTLFPICRSITGNGLRETLKQLTEIIPIEIKEIPSGTNVFDWTIPKEWNIKEGWIKDPQGNKVVDFKDHNLHVLNYSKPFRGKVNLNELKQHLHTIPDKPDLIPYRTSYYTEDWGFCLSHHQMMSLEDGLYEVFVDTSLEDGFLTLGELLIKGESDDEFLFSTHICHPSLANDNLSGIAVLTFLADHLLKRKNHYSYRFLFIPGTIGSIAWLSQHSAQLKKIKGGLVATLLGDRAPFHFKKSRKGDSDLDQIVAYVLEHSFWPFEIVDFSPYGYDERQYCSPGINLAVGNLTRSTFGYYEYHTSADNMDFISADELGKSFEIYREIVESWEQNRTYMNLYPNGEPQLGKRGLYQAIGGDSQNAQLQMAMLWVLNYSDGKHHLLSIAKLSNIPFKVLVKVAEILESHDLLKKVNP